MIKLYQFRPIWGLPNPSPFCLKLETYLRMANIPYELASHADVRKAPKKKLPYIEHEGRVIADSHFIIAYLEKTFNQPVDGHLNVQQRARALAIRHLIEDSLYWAGVYSRWIDSDHWKSVKKAYFGFLPPIIRIVIPEFVRRRVASDIYSQGLGRHSQDEIYQIAKEDVSALSVLLGEQDYFMGNQVCSVDASAYGMLANLIWVPVDSPLKAHAQQLDNLVAYCERMKSAYY